MITNFRGPCRPRCGDSNSSVSDQNEQLGSNFYAPGNPTFDSHECPFYDYLGTSTENILVSNNQFSGPIRDSFTSLQNLDFADFRNNAFTGMLPGSLFDLPNIRIVYFSNNELEGEIPSNFGNAVSLRDLYLDNNRLTGRVPAIGVGELAQLTEFLLQENQLSGAMPASICSLRTPGGLLEDLWADCRGGPGTREIFCSCCTQCF